MGYKILILTLLMQLLTVAFSFAQWSALNVEPSYYLKEAFFVDDSTAYIAGHIPSEKGDTGIVLKTADAGNNWNTMKLGIAVKAVHFTSKSVGYIIVQGGGDKILKTQDGGITWVEKDSASSLRSIYFIDENIGFISASQKIYKTTNGGDSWKVVSEPPSNIESLAFISDQIGLAGGWYLERIVKTTDGGDTWQVISEDYAVYSIYAVSNNALYAAAGNKIIKSTDVGDTWTVLKSDVFSKWSIYCPNKTTCYTVGDSGTILKTTDGGDAWVKQSSGTVADLRSVFCTDSYCYAVGDSGTILRAPNDAETTINDTNLENNIKVFPNPAGHTLTLEYPIGLDVQHIALYDLHGRIVREYPAYAVILELSEITHGPYIVKISTKQGTVRKKIMIK